MYSSYVEVMPKVYVDLRRYVGPHPALVSGITAFPEAKIISKIQRT